MYTPEYKAKVVWYWYMKYLIPMTDRTTHPIEVRRLTEKSERLKRLLDLIDRDIHRSIDRT